MSFKDDDIDNTYKLLKGTEKFCDPSRGLAGLFSSSPDNLSPHEKLYRRSIVADCLLFEAVVSIPQTGLHQLRQGWLYITEVMEDVRTHSHRDGTAVYAALTCCDVYASHQLTST